MVKKFGTFMFIALILCAALMLMVTGNQERYRSPDPETTTVPAGTTVPAETTAPAETTVPTTAPAETKPTETTDPPAVQTEPAVQSPPAAGVKDRVKLILDRNPPKTTAVTRRVHESGLHSAGGSTGLAGQANAYALAEVAQERKMNPIAGFWELVSAGLYAKQTDETGNLGVASFTPPKQEIRSYEYTDKGAQQMITDWLNLAARMEDGLDLELALMGADLAVEKDQVFLSEEEQCRYAYFTCTSERATYILCFYLRGEETITDAEFQLLAMGHASGEAVAVAEIDTAAKKQAANLMAAAELLLTGKTRAAEGNVPFAYEVGGYGAQVERFRFTAEKEDGTLTNYRLQKK